MEKSRGLQTNMDVDYVIVFRYATTEKEKAAARFQELVQRLSSVGLATEVRNGKEHSVLVFVRVASAQHMYAEVYRSRVRDWIHGIRQAEPSKDTQSALEKEPLTEAERLRIIYMMITNPESEGGAGITPKKGEWKNVESVFALHDHSYNKQWIKEWSTKWLLSPNDLDEMRNRLGERIAFYFAFTQGYVLFLTIPAAFGFVAWLLLGHFSAIYGVACSLWCIVFTEWWKYRERDLALRWGVRGVSTLENKRREFRGTQKQVDPVTGETVEHFPAMQRAQRQVLQLPFAIIAAVILGSLITACFGIEVFLSEVYNGPFKSYLVFLPTVLLTVGLPMLSGFLTSLATRLNDYENYETNSRYESALISKIFVLNFVTSYLPIFLTAFVYVPFGRLLVPYLDVFKLTARPFAESEKQLNTPNNPAQFTINPQRLRKQVIYFTVTAQLVNFALEVVVPYLKRQGFVKLKEMQSKRAAKNGKASLDPSADDPSGEKEFLDRLRKEADLDVYDVDADLREMVVQYGYLSLFSVVWPLVGLSFLVNDWVELRADAVKICVEMQRPTPWRADTIGPWLDVLSFLTWLGSITMSALVYLFSNDGLGPDGSPSDIKGWGLLLTIFFSEHIFLLVRWAISTAINSIDSPARQRERRDRYLTRQKYFGESFNTTKQLPMEQSQRPREITRSSLEEDARESSMATTTDSERFWSRQRGWQESAKVGLGFIERAPVHETVKEKKEL
ncbi:DUF590-domain-containing protein [Piedraia hortae CBS 480.64]|uniref:DUF590-domain-containing protein n=1 Tax=Piedraia hortae CBS 480.64 TaxID=1314780 RepID=A0A6A7C8W5_9PEZI|nr:DUF590-domain-containing protein [Piedraia hortae CBS 480.64]